MKNGGSMMSICMLRGAALFLCFASLYGCVVWCDKGEVFDLENGCHVEYIVECRNDADCDDGVVCTDDDCLVGECVHVRDSDLCEEGEVCNEASGCILEAECVRDSDCDEEGNDCNTDSCVNGVCERERSDELCASGYVCGDGGDCVQGREDECATNDGCDDGVACTENRCENGICRFYPNESRCESHESCDRVQGCVNEDWVECELGGDCSDSLTCTRNLCVNHRCQFVDSCDSGFSCSEEENRCVPEAECYSVVDCSDGLSCTDDYCDHGECLNVQVDSRCDDGVACTTDACTVTGCTNTPRDSICATRERCSAVAGCVECFSNSHCGSTEYCDVRYECVSSCGSCDDGNSCTTDICTATGCTHTPHGGVCAGGYCSVTGRCVECLTDAHCGSGEYCDDNTCQLEVECGADVDCDDDVYCTVDDCNTSSECVNTVNNGRCAVGQFCDLLYGCRTSGPDRDSDGIPDSIDNCSSSANPRQEDLDGDHLGDVCDCDADGDLHDGFYCGGWDCNDYNRAVHPSATEVCGDRVDNDCDDQIDSTDADC